MRRYAYKELLDEVFVIFRINHSVIKVEVRVTSRQKPKAETDNPYRDLDYSDYYYSQKPNLIIVFFIH